MNHEQLTVGIAQIAPVWLNRKATLAKVVQYAQEAASRGCELLAFGEGLVPGYPFWVEHTEGARFNSAVQKEIHAHYLRNGVQIEAGHLDELCAVAAQHEMAIYLGTIERPVDRGGHSLYCSLVFIDQAGAIQSVHRKLMPTYEERLVWSTGDGNGLRVHPVGAFTVGGLNCWENWMPLPRAALYGLGENLHVAVWPGNLRNTRDTTPFLAKEGRSYAIAASSVMRLEDVPDDIPHVNLIREKLTEAASASGIIANGGSCIAAPDGSWIIEPLVDEEQLLVTTLDYGRVLEERQNFDPSGHYSRPDVLRLSVDRARQSVIEVIE